MWGGAGQGLTLLRRPLENSGGCWGQSGTQVHAPGDAISPPQVSEGTSQVPAALMACESSLLTKTHWEAK